MPAIEFTQGPLAGQHLVLGDQTYSFGRHPDRDLPLDDKMVSGLHAELRPNEHGWSLVDMGSSNGTLHNAVRVKEAVLTPGDTFQIGSSVVYFHGDETTRVAVDEGES